MERIVQRPSRKSALTATQVSFYANHSPDECIKSASICNILVSIGAKIPVVVSRVLHNKHLKSPSSVGKYFCGEQTTLNISKSRLFLAHGGGGRVSILVVVAFRFVVPFEYRLTPAFDVWTCTDVFTKHWTIIFNGKSFSDSFAYTTTRSYVRTVSDPITVSPGNIYIWPQRP